MSGSSVDTTLKKPNGQFVCKKLYHTKYDYVTDNKKQKCATILLFFLGLCLTISMGVFYRYARERMVNLNLEIDQLSDCVKQLKKIRNEEVSTEFEGLIDIDVSSFH